MRRKTRKIPKQPESFKPSIKQDERVMFSSRIHIPMIFNLCVLGHTDAEIAKVIGISVNVLSRWKNKYPEVMDAIRAGKDEADGRVANALYQAAIGYSHEDVVVLTNRVKVLNDKGKVIETRTEPLIVPVMKHYPPNIRAAIKFLQVRQPGRWSDRTEVSGNITHSHKIDLEGLSIEELKVLKKLSEGKQMEKTVEDAETVEFEETDFEELVNIPLKKKKDEDE